MDFINDPNNLHILAATGLSLLLATASLLYVVAKSGNGSTNRVSKGKPFLNKERQECKLVEKIVISHDTRLFRFGLPSSQDWLGLPTGKHIKVWCSNPPCKVEGLWNGRPDPESGKAEIERKYTPTSSDNDKGHFDLIIKVYSAQTGQNVKFVDGGKMSQYLESLALGDSIALQGPFGLIEYVGHGVFKKSKKEIVAHDLGLLAGGTGITPMLQIIEAILRDPNDPTRISLLYANQSEEDILVRSRLEDLQRENKDRFKLWYTVDRPPANGWKYSTGFISQDMIKDHLPPPKPDTVILMCGPPLMIQFACRANLDALGYNKDLQLEF